MLHSSALTLTLFCLVLVEMVVWTEGGARPVVKCSRQERGRQHQD